MADNIKLKRGEFLLYSFKNVNLNELVDEHIKLHTITSEERKREYIDAIHEFFGDRELSRKLEKELQIISKGGKKLPDKTKTILYHKFKYLIHLIAKNSYYIEGSDIAQIRILASILHETFNNNDYVQLLYTLAREGMFIEISHYKKKKSARTFYISDKFYNYSNIHCEASSHKKTKFYIDRANKLIDEKYVKTEFDKIYNKNLSKLKLINKEGAEKFTNEIIKNTNKKRKKLLYRKSLIKLIDYNSNNYIRLTKDDNKRIYHVLTNVKREFKQFLNISYSIDIKNSHPVIFNNFLIRKYNIKKYNLDIIFNIINSITYNNNLYSYNNIINDITYHKDYEKSINVLIDKILENHSDLTDTIPSDVIKYIILTSKGQLWDLMIEKCKDVGLGLYRGKPIDRNRIKQKMFSEVFYSNKKGLTYKLDNRNVYIDKRFGKVFNDIFPNVYNAVEYFKPDGEESQLSNDMMALEAKLFHQILEELFKYKGLDVISIHDAILMLNTSDEKYTPQLIEEVIIKVYYKYRLFPTVSIDVYNPK